MVLPVAVEAMKWEQQDREKEEERDKGRSEKLSDEIKTVSHSISKSALCSSYSRVLLSPSSVLASSLSIHMAKWEFAEVNVKFRY